MSKQLQLLPQITLIAHIFLEENTMQMATDILCTYSCYQTGFSNTQSLICNWSDKQSPTTSLAWANKLSNVLIASQSHSVCTFQENQPTLSYRWLCIKLSKRKYCNKKVHSSALRAKMREWVRTECVFLNCSDRLVCSIMVRAAFHRGAINIEKGQDRTTLTHTD